MRFQKTIRIVSGLAVCGALAAAAFYMQDYWRPLFTGPVADEQDSEAEAAAPMLEPKMLKMTSQARKNLGLVTKPARTGTYWRKIQVPGVVVDRPGRSDRGVTSPAVGVVTHIHAFPGDTVRPGDQLFTLRLFSEYLQNTQKEFFTATQEIVLIQEQLARLRPLAETGGIAKTMIIELQNQLRRQAATIQAHRQDLLTRGLTPEQIEGVAEGKFVSAVDVVAPPIGDQPVDAAALQQTTLRSPDGQLTGLEYEVQELNTGLGQQVQAGQLLATLANHSSLYIEGHAFKREAPLLERAAQNGWPITVEFAEDDAQHWPNLEQSFEIRHLANAIDTASRTFDFFIPLTNQSRAYSKGDETFVVWRFRPGQRVRLHVPVEELSNVFVLPAASVVREGPEAYVFRQNGDIFNRVAVNVLHEDRLNIVIANDGSVTPGLYFAQNSAASLNRVLKAQAASGMQADVHVHADGTVHAAHK